MSTVAPVIIPFNKAKLWGLCICCVLFIVLGFFFVLAPYDFRSPLIHNLFIIRLLGFVALALFGYFLGQYLPKLSNKVPGLRIDDKGITDHSTASSVGFIQWEDVTEVHRQSIAGQKYMVIKVRNPEAYIGRAPGTDKRLLKGNLQLCGSPVAISATPLKCNFKQLENLLTAAFNRHKMR